MAETLESSNPRQSAGGGNSKGFEQTDSRKRDSSVGQQIRPSSVLKKAHIAEFKISAASDGEPDPDGDRLLPIHPPWLNTDIPHAVNVKKTLQLDRERPISNLESADYV